MVVVAMVVVIIIIIITAFTVLYVNALGIIIWNSRECKDEATSTGKVSYSSSRYSKIFTACLYRERKKRLYYLRLYRIVHVRSLRKSSSMVPHIYYKILQDFLRRGYIVRKRH